MWRVGRFFTTTLQTEAGHVKQPSFITNWLLKPHIFTLQQLWISCRFQFRTNMFNQSHINTLVLRESQVCSSGCGASEHVIRLCSVLWFLIKWISSFCFHSAQWNMFSKQKIRRAQPVQNKPQRITNIDVPERQRHDGLFHMWLIRLTLSGSGQHRIQQIHIQQYKKHPTGNNSSTQQNYTLTSSCWIRSLD